MKKGFLIILLLIIFFGLAASVQADTKTIVPYLELEGAKDPTAGIPQYIRYIFVFSLGLVGIIAFIAMLLAAIGYVTSVGNPQKAADAKDKIFSALLGMLILLGSYVLLNTINPDLLKFKETIVGEKVTIKVDVEKMDETCQPTEAYWDKRVVNAGESANLIFTLNKSCPEDAIIEVGCQDHFARQDRPVNLLGGAEAVMGWDPYCDIYRTGNYNRGENSAGRILIKYLYFFGNLTAIPTIGQCRDGLDISSCLGPTQIGNEICNFHKNEPEMIYVKEKCWMIINGQKRTEFFVRSKLLITVRDLRADGLCCK